jgi:citrate lyase beta subunit
VDGTNVNTGVTVGETPSVKAARAVGLLQPAARTRRPCSRPAEGKGVFVFEGRMIARPLAEAERAIPARAAIA